MATVRKRTTLMVWQDVIFAIFLREIRSKFSDKFGISWAIISPVAFIFVLSFMRGRMSGSDVHSIPVFLFMMYGLVGIQMFLQTMSLASGAIRKSKPLFAFRQVQPISAVLAVGLLEYLVKIFVVLSLFVIAYFCRIEIQIDSLLQVIIVYTLLWLIAVSIGLIVSIASGFIEEIGKLVELATRPLFFISAVFFSLKDVPKEYWYWLDWNPILHGIELVRFAAYSSYGDDGVSMGYLVMMTLIIVSLALAVYTAFWKQVISR